MNQSVRPLPILTADGELPSGEALLALRASKKLSGYSGMVLPVKAVPGSPEPILCVGVTPDWLCTFALIPDLSNIDRTTAALDAVLVNNDDPRLGSEEVLLSKWMGVEVKMIEQESRVSFS